jgi:hypothetical protein
MVALFSATCHFAAAKPRVLILGDSYARGHAAEVSKLLKDQAGLVFVTTPPEEVYDTATVLTKIDAWLGDQKWDLIYFNIGLYDLTYRSPGMKSFRVMSRSGGGVRNTSPEDYEKNLRELVQDLSATKAKLIWASTLPIGQSLLDIHEPGSEIEYNRIAEKIMTESGITIHDLHAYGLTLLSPKEREAGVQPGQFVRKSIDSPMITAICRELNLKLPPQTHDGKKR